MFPTVSIENPIPQQLVPVSRPLLVAGIASGVGGAEPSLIDSVMVSVSGAGPVAATLKPLASHGTAAPTVSYSATLPFPSLAGDVGIVVTAKDDMGVEATATVTVVGHEPGPAAFTPQSSLQVFGTNPAPPFGGDWATRIVKDDRSPAADLATIASAVIKWERGDQFPVCSREWTQVTTPARTTTRMLSSSAAGCSSPSCPATMYRSPTRSEMTGSAWSRSIPRTPGSWRPETPCPTGATGRMPWPPRRV